MVFLQINTALMQKIQNKVFGFILIGHKIPAIPLLMLYISLSRWKWGDHVKSMNYLLTEKGSNRCGVLKSFENCPYVFVYSSSEESLWVNFRLQVDHKWRLERAEKNPVNTLGLESVEVFELSKISGESVFPKGKTEGSLIISLCGSDCLQCPLTNSICEGCPQTVHFERNETE